jgi:hypothetical protein
VFKRNTLKTILKGATMNQTPQTITDIYGSQIPVRMEPHRVDTRYCPTTADAVWCKRVTHRVSVPERGDWIYRGTLAECQDFIAQRQTAEATRALAAGM